MIKRQWLAKYFFHCLECDAPILEAVYYLYPCKSIDAIWARLSEQADPTPIKHPIEHKRICNEIMDVMRWAGWARDTIIWQGFTYNVAMGRAIEGDTRIVCLARTPSRHVDQVLQAGGVGQSFAVIYVAVHGTTIIGWLYELSAYGRAALFRKVLGKSYCRCVVLADCNRKQFSWNLAADLTRQMRLDQEYEAEAIKSEMALAQLNRDQHYDLSESRLVSEVAKLESFLTP